MDSSIHDICLGGTRGTWAAAVAPGQQSGRVRPTCDDATTLASGIKAMRRCAASVPQFAADHIADLVANAAALEQVQSDRRIPTLGPLLRTLHLQLRWPLRLAERESVNPH